MIIKFLEALAMLVRMKNGGQDNDVSRLLNYARLGVRAGDTGKRHLQAAVAKVEQLVAEDRGLTDQELKDLDESIRGKLARAAGVVIPPDEPNAPTAATGTENGPSDETGAGPADPP